MMSLLQSARFSLSGGSPAPTAEFVVTPPAPSTPAAPSSSALPAVMAASADESQDEETQKVIPLPVFPSDPPQQRQRGRPPPAQPLGRGRSRSGSQASAAPASLVPSRHQPRSPVPVTPPQDSRERHGYLEAIRQLKPDNMTAMQKLGATLLTGLTGADAVDLINVGATLDPQQLAALRTILSRPTPLARPAVSEVASPASARATRYI
jgi:hypothetical protein